MKNNDPIKNVLTENNDLLKKALILTVVRLSKEFSDGIVDTEGMHERVNRWLREAQSIEWTTESWCNDCNTYGFHEDWCVPKQY